jgi:hypothetical protein
MTRRFYRFKALAAVLATLVLNGPASAGKHETPFTGTSSGFVSTVGFDPEQNIVYTRLEGQGEATHLKHFTVTADVRIYVATPTGIAIGTWTYTAENGDKLFAILAGHAGVDSFHGEGTLTIVGGTGRFQGASGSWQELNTFSVDPKTAPVVAYSDVLYNGTIALPGSGRR